MPSCLTRGEAQELFVVFDAVSGPIVSSSDDEAGGGTAIGGRETWVKCDCILRLKAAVDELYAYKRNSSSDDIKNPIYETNAFAAYHVHHFAENRYGASQTRPRV